MRELLELLEAGPSNSLLLGLAWLAGQELARSRGGEGGDAPRGAAACDRRRPTSRARSRRSRRRGDGRRSRRRGARERLEDALARLTADSEGLAAVSGWQGCERSLTSPGGATQARCSPRRSGRTELELGHPSDRADRRGENRDHGEQRAERPTTMVSRSRSSPRVRPRRRRRAGSPPRRRTAATLARPRMRSGVIAWIRLIIVTL